MTVYQRRQISIPWRSHCPHNRMTGSSYYGDFIKVMVKRMYLKDTEAAPQFAAADYFHQTGDNELLITIISMM